MKPNLRRYQKLLGIAVTVAVSSVLAATISGAVGADMMDVKINEFVSDTGTIQQEEWIELYNAGSEDIDLAGWTIEDGTNNPVSLDGNTIRAGDYLLLVHGTNFGFGLNNSGDVIILKNGGIEVDRVAYGNWDDGNTANNAAKPGKDESVGRCPDGSDTNVDSSDFSTFEAPSPNASNPCQPGSGGGGTIIPGDTNNSNSSGAIPGVTGWGAGIAVLAFATVAIVVLRRRQSLSKA